MQRYNPKDIEPKWQKTWDEHKAYEVHDDAPGQKFYQLVEFPYPSGAGLHVGHCRPYITFDVMSRWRRMNGENVLYPIGWDAFGLPAEQYAVKTGIHPAQTTKTNIDNFRNQAKCLGLSFDWSREFSTADPENYKWTQWIFLQLFKHGLAYQAESQIWWCEGLKSVLADEEVINGRSERGDFPCERRNLRQWMLAITQYADRLYDDLDDVDYIEPVKIQQRNWIGRSKGAEINFTIDKSDQKLKIFTTRADTIFGATFMVVAPEHPIVKIVTTPGQKQVVEAYVKQTASKSDLERQESADKEKTGAFTGAYAINPANNEQIPIWISDYVLMGYGTGAIMAVPAHDERDHDFAKKFNLSMRPVVSPSFIKEGVSPDGAVDRNVAMAVAHDPATDKYCVIEWVKGHDREGIEWPGGGIDAGESIEEGAIREFIEETGYTDVTVEKIVPAAVSFYYASEESGTRRAVKNIVKLRVNSLKHNGTIGTESYEQGVYEVKWLTREEVLANFNTMAPQYQTITSLAFDKAIHVGEGILINSGAYDHLPTSEAREKIVSDLSAKGVGQERTNYKLRDWVFSRQRYWGEPFPIVWVRQSEANRMYGEVAEWLPKTTVTKQVDGVEYVALPIPPQFLPLELPEVQDFQPKGLGQGPLAEAEDWVHVWYNLETGEAKQFVTKPEGDKWIEGHRETDTMPNWAGSSWYFLRYLDPHNNQTLAAPEKIQKWMPVDWYNGGMEHTTLHLLYSRFWHKFLYDIKVVNTAEPYKKRTSHGLVLAEDGRKMSKSWGNVVDPLEVVESYGADTLRLYICFMGPFDQTVSWSMNGVAGCRRFIDRLWTLVGEFQASDIAKNDSDKANIHLQKIVAKANKRITHDIPSLGFNTAVAALMEAVNEFYKLKTSLAFTDAPHAWHIALSDTVLLLAPFAPHVSEELWHMLGNDGTTGTTAWPVWNDSVLAEAAVTIAVQVNGKLRGQVIVSSDSSEAAVLTAAQAEPKVRAHILDKSIIKTIYVPRKIVNIVVK